MISLDESTLIAYVDGELDTQTAREVEAALGRNADARKYVEHLRALAALTRVAFNDTLHDAVPQRLKDAAMATVHATAAPRGLGADMANVVTFAPRPRTDWRRALPMAAAVAGVVLGLGGGFKYAENSAHKAIQLAALSLQQDQTSMEQTLNQALEVNMSGNALTWNNPDSGRSAAFTPVRTYQDKSGQFCREYRKDITTAGETQTTFGLACRDDAGHWKTRYLILDEGQGQSL